MIAYKKKALSFPIFLLFSFFVSANQSYSSVKLATKLYLHKKYYSSYTVLKANIKKNTAKNAKILAYKLIDRIHPAVFKNDSDLDQFFDKSTPLNFAVAVRALYLGDLKSTVKFLYHIRKDHPSLMEVSYMRGMVYYIKKEYSLAIKKFKQCTYYAGRKTKNNLKTKHYIQAFRNRCIQQLARVYFEQKNYKMSLKFLNKVQKIDYVWPRFLFDKAWNYYWLDKKPQTLGTLVTYKASYLRRFITPEANYLRALTYYDLCYFEKAEKIYNEFLSGIYKERNIFKTMTAKQLRGIIFRRRKAKLSTKNRFITNYLRGYRKDTKIFSFKSAMKELMHERKSISGLKSKKLKSLSLKLRKYQRFIRLDFDEFLTKLTKEFSSEISKTNKKFLRLKLALGIQRKKHIIKKSNENFEDKFKDLNLSQIDDVSEKFVWEFKGGFWADELGDYAVALKDQCHET